MPRVQVIVRLEGGPRQDWPARRASNIEAVVASWWLEPNTSGSTLVGRAEARDAKAPTIVPEASNVVGTSGFALHLYASLPMSTAT